MIFFFFFLSRRQKLVNICFIASDKPFVLLGLISWCGSERERGRKFTGAPRFQKVKLPLSHGIADNLNEKIYIQAAPHNISTVRTFNEAPVVMTLKQGTLRWDNYLAPSQLSFTDALLTAHSMP